MSYQARGVDITLPAGADLSAAQFKFVKMTSTGIAVAGAGEPAVGVLQNKPGIGQPATVRFHGISKVKADAAVARGGIVASSADGEAVVSATAGHIKLGVALEAAGAAGEVIPVLLGSPATGDEI